MQEMLKAGVNEGGGTSQALRHYTFGDTDWGGKTGTSNNHSDAWFMAVSPKLVVGAWVGGEYRSIHFRTGALGQGSKTALPICGEFIYSLMRDKAFQKYHAKWQLDPDEDIDPSMYNCQPTVVRRAAPDSLRDFTTGHRRHQEEEEEPIDGHENTDEGGFILEPAPQPTPERQGNSSNNESPQIIKKAKKPRSEDMEI